MAEFNRALLSLIQRRIPLVRQPFALVAAELGCDESAVLDGVRCLRSEGLIREISGLFNAPSLGYAQTLVAMRIDPQHLDEAGRIVAAHPGVSHCYGRSGQLNLWFTLAVAPQSEPGLEATTRILGRICHADDVLSLPTKRRYKLYVHFDAGLTGETLRSSDATALPAEVPRTAAGVGPTKAQRRAIRALQVDLPTVRDPFPAIAAEARMDADELLVHAADFLAAEWMRRYAAAVDHRAAGVEANVLVAWHVDDAQADRAGAAAAGFSAVSHCYLRAVAQAWPYNLYTMIHGLSREDCRMCIQRIAAATGLSDFAELWTTANYKKQRIRLFTDDQACWEAQHARS